MYHMYHCDTPTSRRDMRTISCSTESCDHKIVVNPNTRRPGAQKGWVSVQTCRGVVLDGDDAMEHYGGPLEYYCPTCAQVTTQPRHLPSCGLCLGPMSKNPHPDAGIPKHLLEVGAIWTCIPCTVRARHKAFNRAQELEIELEALDREKRHERT